MAEQRQELVIEAGRTEKQYWRDLWHYRELFFFLAWRDILVRYKQTTVGIIWAVLRPLSTIVVFTLVFHKVAKIDSNGVPYALLVSAATLPWQFFSGALSDAGNSLVGNSNLISKVYFPRLIVPAGTIVTSIVDSLISFGLVGLLMVWYHYSPGWRILAIPIFFMMAAGLAVGGGLWLSALTVKYRDFRIVGPFIISFGQFISPVGFTSDRVPANLFAIYSLNPLVGIIDGFRWALLGGNNFINWASFTLSIVMVVLILISGIWYFRRTERTFADII